MSIEQYIKAELGNVADGDMPTKALALAFTQKEIENYGAAAYVCEKKIRTRVYRCVHVHT